MLRVGPLRAAGGNRSEGGCEGFFKKGFPRRFLEGFRAFGGLELPSHLGFRAEGLKWGLRFMVLGLKDLGFTGLGSLGLRLTDFGDRIGVCAMQMSRQACDGVSWKKPVGN